MKLKLSPVRIEMYYPVCKWRFLPEMRDERSAALTEIDSSLISFSSALQPTDPQLTVEQKLEVAKPSGKVLLGASVHRALLSDFIDRGTDSVLEEWYQKHGIERIDFLGDGVQFGDNPKDWGILYLYRESSGVWNWSMYWLDDLVDNASRTAIIW